VTGFITPLLRFRKLLKYPNVSVGVANPDRHAHYSSLYFMKLLCLAFVSTKTRINITLFSAFAIGVTTALGAGVIIHADCIKRYAGECPLSQSLSALFMRVCQPLPVARKASKTSASSRIPVNTFGVSVRGLPPLGFSISAAKVAPRISGKASDAGRIRVKSSSVSSGESSSGSSAIGCESINSQSMLCVGFIFSNLTFVCFAKTNNSYAL